MPSARGSFALGLACAVLSAAHTQAAQKPKTVTVLCNKGGSINAALAAVGDPLTIEIRGICAEDVLVRRDNVTLHGLDPVQDGIQGVAPNAPGRAVLRVENANNIRIQNLVVTGGSRNGIWIGPSILTTASNCRAVGNANFQVVVSNAGVARISDTVIGTGIERFGLGFFGADLSRCSNCTISVAERAVDANNSRFIIEDSTLTAPDGIFVDDLDGTAQVIVSNSTIDATNVALRAARHSAFSIEGGTLRGSVASETSSLITLDGASQVSNPGQNRVGAGSNLRVLNGSSLQGDAIVQDFGNLALLDASSIQGSLSCSSGGNAFCASSSAVSGSTSGCSLCIKP